MIKRLLILFLLLAAGARAEWRDLKEGLAPDAVAKCVGQPLLQSAGQKGTYVTWMYDRGGYVMFRDGKVTCWRKPQG